MRAKHPTCPECGKPLTKMDPDLGMFCEDECEREASIQAKALLDPLIQAFAGLMERQPKVKSTPLDGNRRCYRCHWYGTDKKYQRINGRSRAVCVDGCAMQARWEKERPR